MGEYALVGTRPDAVIFAACGTLIYLWLVVVAAPLVRGLETTVGAARGEGWAPGLAVVLGLVFSMTVVPLAILFLAATFAPAVGLVVITSRATVLGALCGVIVFAIRSAMLGLPRISPRLELALVESGIAWNPDEEQVDRFERAYREHILPPARRAREFHAGPATGVQPGPVRS